MSIRKITESEWEQLQKLASSTNGTVAKRARTVLVAALGIPRHSIAQALGISGSTLNNTVKSFNAGGPAALELTGRTGRPPTVNDEDREALIALMRRSPTEFGIQELLWYQTDLIATAKSEGILCGVSGSTIRNEVVKLSDLRPDLRHRLKSNDRRRNRSSLRNPNPENFTDLCVVELPSDDRASVTCIEDQFMHDFPEADEEAVRHIRAAAEAYITRNRALNNKPPKSG